MTMRSDKLREERQRSIRCDARGAARETANGKSVLVLLLVLSAAINYIDRGSLSIAAPVLAIQLSLTPVQLGLLFSAFFWSYTGFMVPAGWLSDRYNVKWVLAAGFLLWSLATLGVGFVSTLYALLFMRLILGLGESVAYPCISKVFAQFPIDRRGLPNALVDAGAKVGPAIGTLVGGLVVARYGWRFLFVVLGLVSLAWLVPWFLWAPRESHVTSNGPESGPGIVRILAKRDAWGTFLGNFCCNYAYYFLLTWLPSYLVNERHVSVRKMAILGSLPFAASAATSIFGGWSSDRWIRSGASPTRVRKTFVVSGLLLSTLMLPSAIVNDLTLSMGLLIAAYCAFGLFSSNHWAITQTLAGPVASGKWTGLQNFFANCAGVTAPYITGLIVSKTGSYYMAFLSASIVLVIGAVSYLLIVGKVQPIAWPEQKLAPAGEVALAD
jgi:MFS transporter, ACS family, D-galactonate transporter